jgi:hypothetical protein
MQTILFINYVTNELVNKLVEKSYGHCVSHHFQDKLKNVFTWVGILVPELQRFYGRAVVFITPIETPINDLSRPLAIISFVLYLPVYRVILE